MDALIPDSNLIAEENNNISDKSFSKVWDVANDNNAIPDLSHW